MTTWWQGLSSAEAVVECDGKPHRLLWEAGALRALEHGDAEGERTLAALGGARCTCLDLLDTWARHSDDLDVLLLASRGPGDQLLAPEDITSRAVAAQMPRVPRQAALSHLDPDDGRTPRPSSHDAQGLARTTLGGLDPVSSPSMRSDHSFVTPTRSEPSFRSSESGRSGPAASPRSGTGSAYAPNSTARTAGR